MNQQLTQVYEATQQQEDDSFGLFSVFAFDHFEPKGGANDFIGMAVSLSQARTMVNATGIRYGKYQIMNHNTLEIVENNTFGRLN